MNPQFYRSYELDVTFPEDWRLEILIYDKGGLLGDNLIGSTVIDLEDRFFGDQLNQSREALEVYREIYLEQKKKLEKARRGEREDEKRAVSIKLEEIQREMTLLERQEQIKVPVEYRELKMEGKEQTQGMIEMWVEVLQRDEAR